MKKLKVGVTGINAVDSPGPGVPILRSLRKSGRDVSLIGMSYDVLEPGNFMDSLVDSSYIIPYPNSGTSLLLERIQYIHSIVGLDVIIPALDSELTNYITIEPELKKMGIKTCLPDKKQLALRDKSALNDTFEKSNVLLPKTYTIQDSSAIAQVAEDIGFPLFVKGIYYEAYLARTLQEAIGYFYYLAGKWGIPIILQQFIPGEELNAAIFASEGKLISHVVMKKMFVTDKGKAWAGVTINNKEVSESAVKIMDQLKWNSGCELEFIVENQTGKVYLLEMNPRLPAWVYLATEAGLNLPDLIVKAALGEELSVNNQYDVGKIFVRHSWDEIVPMSSIEALSTKAEIKYRD
ncbi:MAG: ATP-grasp domain-containing protein [Leptospiraceae bacterium]|nr:ATP-grasp domain-containing protein [Leptospiraceae bacterium]MCP5511149.1 ATP-grasp domain-containing protein [Leptospiraceae bacterium]